MSNIVIGIEGFVGSGKTSICRKLLEHIPNSIILHGGNLYRAIVCVLMDSGIEIENLKHSLQNIDIKSIMDKLGVEIKIENRESVIYVNKQLIKEEIIQSKNSSMAVSIVGGIADNSKLYVFAKKLIDEFKKEYNVIVSGRALLSIYPEMDYHLFLTASLGKRIERKYIQYKEKVSKEEIRQNIIKRDELQEKAGFYDVSSRTIKIDLSDFEDVDSSTNKVLEYISVNKI